MAKIGSLPAKTVSALTGELSNMTIESDLRRKMRDNIRRLRDMGSYRGRRHAMVRYPRLCCVLLARLWALDGGLMSLRALGFTGQGTTDENTDFDGPEAEQGGEERLS